MAGDVMFVIDLIALIASIGLLLWLVKYFAVEYTNRGLLIWVRLLDFFRPVTRLYDRKKS